MDIFSGIEKSHIIYNDMAFIRRHYAGNTFEKHTFSTAGFSKYRNPVILGLELNIQRKISKIFFYRNIHRHYPHLPGKFILPENRFIKNTTHTDMATIRIDQKPAIRPLSLTI